MTWMPKEYSERIANLSEERRATFIENAKKADFGFAAMVEMMHESPNFEKLPPHEKQFIIDFIEARKTETK
jgi:hypothetical protein